jgi:chromosome segregation ATPase
MEPEIDYTPEGRNKIEIDKLHAEVVELRSRLRRWIGSLGGVVGILTAAVSVIVTSQQLSRKSQETATEKNQLAADRRVLSADRAKFDADRAKVDLAEATAKKADAEKQEERAEARVKEADKHFAEVQSQAGAAESKLAETDRQFKIKTDELNRLQNGTAKLAESLKNQPGAQRQAADAMALVDSTRNLIESEHRRLVEDNSRARLFFFVLNGQQRETAWKLEPALRAADFYIGNVIVFSGKRDETPALRYFRDADKAEAEKLRSTLVRLGLEKIHLSRVNDPDSAGTGRKFQIWVTKEDLQ